MKISYECSDLIEELKEDIEEFGDIEFYAYFKKINNSTFLVDYNFIDNDTLEDLESDTVVQTLKASQILKILEEQNRIL